MSDDGGEYEVGYGKPPKHTRFKPGQSGNPKGRPKRARNLSTLIEEELNRRIPVKDEGRIRHMTKKVALVRNLVNYAVKGDPKARRQLLPILEAMETSAEARKAGTPSADEDMKILQEAFERMAGNAVEPPGGTTDDPDANSEGNGHA